MSVQVKESKTPVYRITFGWGTESYQERRLGPIEFDVNVEAPDKFAALHAAWDYLAPLNLAEPDKMNVRKIDRC